MSLVLNQIPGVVENGLFIDICDTLIVGLGDGRVELREVGSEAVEESRVDFVEADNIFTDIAD